MNRLTLTMPELEGKPTQEIKEVLGVLVKKMIEVTAVLKSVGESRNDVWDRVDESLSSDYPYWYGEIPLGELMRFTVDEAYDFDTISIVIDKNAVRKLREKSQ